LRTGASALTGSDFTSIKARSTLGAGTTAFTVSSTTIIAIFLTGFAVFLEAVFFGAGFPLGDDIFAATAFFPFVEEIVIFVFFFGFVAVIFLTAFTIFLTVVVAFWVVVFFAAGFFVVSFSLFLPFVPHWYKFQVLRVQVSGLGLDLGYQRFNLARRRGRRGPSFQKKQLIRIILFICASFQSWTMDDGQ
jgi:hypothetical protein